VHVQAEQAVKAHELVTELRNAPKPKKLDTQSIAAIGVVGESVHGFPLELSEVNFTYDGADTPALRDVNMKIESGQHVAIIGPSGAGKTTISALLPRLYDVTEGAITIDGNDLRDLSLSSLRDSIGVVMQDSHLFHDTISANLKYAKADASFEEMKSACQSAQIWDLIASLPNGLETMVGERGHRLSGGEKQRLAIARLLLKSPSIVILDEATAHLDSENEELVQRALGNALQGRTSIVIAHRLSTVMNADQIIVLEGGVIRERGKHEDLVRSGGLYSELFARQDLTAPN
jgi:ATP-binding cassette subfamily B protein